MDAVLDESGARERRLRSLPSRVGVYFVLALGLFEHLGTGLVWGKLGAGLAARVPQPSEKALRDLRRRVGVALAQAAVRRAGRPAGPAVHTRSALPPLADGRLRRLREPVRPRPRAQPVLARPHRTPLRPDRPPPLMLMTLCETGTAV
ncbi:transposase domain-containing protein [Streptomyces malaysiensis]|nr:transposase domain-containing protein [Streptomyces malaysiensis]